MSYLFSCQLFVALEAASFNFVSCCFCLTCSIICFNKLFLGCRLILFDRFYVTLVSYLLLSLVLFNLQSIICFSSQLFDTRVSYFFSSQLLVTLLIYHHNIQFISCILPVIYFCNDSIASIFPHDTRKKFKHHLFWRTIMQNDFIKCEHGFAHSFLRGAVNNKRKI